jgi:hypothetical protein
MLYARGRRLREGCHGRCRKRGSGIAAVRAMGASRVCRDLGSRPASRFRSIRFQRKRSTPARAGWRRERSKFRLRTDRSRPNARCRERADRFRPSLSSRRYSAFTSTSRTFADAWLSSAISRSRPSYMRDKATRRRSATSRSSWRKSYPKCRMLSRCRISMRPWPLPRRRGRPTPRSSPSPASAGAGAPCGYTLLTIPRLRQRFPRTAILSCPPASCSRNPRSTSPPISKHPLGLYGGGDTGIKAESVEKMREACKAAGKTC